MAELKDNDLEKIFENFENPGNEENSEQDTVHLKEEEFSSLATSDFSSETLDSVAPGRAGPDFTESQFGLLTSKRIETVKTLDAGSDRGIAIQESDFNDLTSGTVLANPEKTLSDVGTQPEDTIPEKWELNFSEVLDEGNSDDDGLAGMILGSDDLGSDIDEIPPVPQMVNASASEKSDAGSGETGSVLKLEDLVDTSAYQTQPDFQDDAVSQPVDFSSPEEGVLSKEESAFLDLEKEDGPDETAEPVVDFDNPREDVPPISPEPELSELLPELDGQDLSYETKTFDTMLVTEASESSLHEQDQEETIDIDFVPVREMKTDETTVAPSAESSGGEGEISLEGLAFNVEDYRRGAGNSEKSSQPQDADFSIASEAGPDLSVMQDLSDALSSGTSDGSGGENSVNAETYAAYIQGVSQERSNRTGTSEEDSEDTEDHHGSEPARKAKKALEKIKETPSPVVVSGKKKRGFFKRALFYLLIMFELSVFLYFYPVFLIKAPGYWYAPPVAFAVFLVHFLAAVRKDALPVTFFLMTVFLLIEQSVVFLIPFDPGAVVDFWKTFPEAATMFTMLGMVTMWLPLALTDINKKMRLFLTLIAIYGMIGFIFMIRNRTGIDALLEYSPLGETPYFITPFFVFLNGFLPLASAVLLLYLPVTIFRMEGKNMLRAFSFLVPAIFLFINGNLIYHFNGFFSPMALFFSRSGGERIRTSFSLDSFNESELKVHFSRLEKMMTCEVLVRRGTLAISEDGIKKFDLPPGSFFFPGSDNLSYLQKGKLSFRDEKGRVQPLIKSREDIICFDIFSSRDGNWVVYVVKADGGFAIRKYLISSESDELVEKIPHQVDELAVSRTGKHMIYRCGDDAYCRSGNQTTRLKSGGRDFVFAPGDEDLCYYSAWDEKYGSYSIWRMKTGKQDYEQLIFDSGDKRFPSPSHVDGNSKESHLAFVRMGDRTEIWVAACDGNDKTRLFQDFEGSEKVTRISWLFDNSALFVSTDRRGYLMPLNLIREKTLAGSKESRVKDLERELNASGWKAVRVNLERGLIISAVAPETDVANAVGKLALSAYACLPEFRAKQYFQLEMRRMGNSEKVLIPLSGAPFFTQASVSDWRQKITWR
ncbi:MAG: hypothetical protein PHQ23_00870 [Candidatus Wallbacteria bacterium]|nr:hypothetical protein [Candidatus Wallbacteria bacterium]